MKSHEVLKKATDNIGVKSLAAELKLSPALVYKWCQESGDAASDTSGARNPLDRLADIVRVTKSRSVVSWLCQEAGGFFVSNPELPVAPTSVELLGETQKLVKEFSQLLVTVTRSIEDDGFIEGIEADNIRQSWERLKEFAEAFCVCCEAGRYAPKKNDTP
jgi:hypothetical protein